MNKVEATLVLRNLTKARDFLTEKGFLVTDTPDDLSKRQCKDLYNIIFDGLSFAEDRDCDGVYRNLNVSCNGKRLPVLFTSKCLDSDDFEKYLTDVSFDQVQSEQILVSLKELIDFVEPFAQDVVYVNLTPHTIKLYAPEDIHKRNVDAEPVFEFPASGNVARVSTVFDLDMPQENQPQTGSTKYGDIHGLPDPKPGVKYIVSTIAFEAAKTLHKRTDVVFPGGHTLRADDGSILGMEFLSR